MPKIIFKYWFPVPNRAITFDYVRFASLLEAVLGLLVFLITERLHLKVNSRHLLNHLLWIP